MSIGLRAEIFSRVCMFVGTGCGKWRSRRIKLKKIPGEWPARPKMCTLSAQCCVPNDFNFENNLIVFDRIHVDLQVQSGELHQHSRARAPTVINSAFIHNNYAIASNSEVDF